MLGARLGKLRAILKGATHHFTASRNADPDTRLFINSAATKSPLRSSNLQTSPVRPLMRSDALFRMLGHEVNHDVDIASGDATSENSTPQFLRSVPTCSFISVFWLASVTQSLVKVTFD